jgi:hypothetical protein
LFLFQFFFKFSSFHEFLGVVKINFNVLYLNILKLISINLKASSK